MTDRSLHRLRRLASRLAQDRPIGWAEEEHRANSDEEREALRQLRSVAAMAALNRAIQLDPGGEELSASVSSARSLVEGEAESEAASPSAMSQPQLAPGYRWGQLEILGRVGRGAFGDVYRARDVRLDREVALKILTQESADPMVEGETVREARLLARINHPNVVLGACEMRFLKPVRVSDTLVAWARLDAEQGKKRFVKVDVRRGEEVVATATCTCFVPDRHVLDPAPSS